MIKYDAIVVGAGGVGSAVMFHMARRGARVLGLDRFSPGHDRGSSHGQTRIIRQAYFEHPDYVPLLRRAYQLWTELEQRCGEQLFFPVGLLQIGPPNGMVLAGVLESARRYDLDVDRYSAAEAIDRFPGFHVPTKCAAVFERQAGYLLVENCVLAHVQEATKLGVELLTGEAVTGWHVDGTGVNVRTDSARFTARRLVITAGAWADQLLRDLAIPLRVLQKHLHWFVNNDPRYHRDRGSPAFLYELPDGIFYGFPQHDKLGVKVGEHSGGEAVTDPLTAGRSVDRADRERVEEFLRAHLPGVSRDVTRHSVCYYTMSPDEHFIVDRHPQYEAVVFAAGLSGHGFKFTSVLGEVLTDLSLDGKTNLPIGFLNCRRPTLRQ